MPLICKQVAVLVLTLSWTDWQLVNTRLVKWAEYWHWIKIGIAVPCKNANIATPKNTSKKPLFGLPNRTNWSWMVLWWNMFGHRKVAELMCMLSGKRGWGFLWFCVNIFWSKEEESHQTTVLFLPIHSTAATAMTLTHTFSLSPFHYQGGSKLLTDSISTDTQTKGLAMKLCSVMLHTKSNLKL